MVGIEMFSTVNSELKVNSTTLGRIWFLVETYIPACFDSSSKGFMLAKNAVNKIVPNIGLAEKVIRVWRYFGRCIMLFSKCFQYCGFFF